MGDIGSQIGGPTDPAGPHAPFPPAGWSKPQTSTSAVFALVCAVGSWVLFPLVPAIVALILARNAQEEIATSAGRVTGAGLANAARVTAWANIITSTLVIVGALLVLVLIGAWWL
ncbi:MAG TPA: hypothetical protein VNA20_16855 [Frankiaceae bacterium]|nr:hypothetical protein [Frankiaceae bacterium]